MLAQPAQRLATALQEHSDISGSNANNRRPIGRSFATDLLSVHHASLADRGSRALLGRLVWQPLLILIFVLNTAWAVSSALVLQRSAKQANARALESVRQKLCRLPEKGSELRIKRFNKIQEDISVLNSGAFAGYLNNPILGALSLPVMGTAVALAIEFLTNR
jgi:hypothetical protein